MRVGLTGGVGSGKSTVGALLAERGAVVIDADQLAREVVEPGTPGFEAVVARFGPDVVEDGRLNRPALAAIVFDDEHARADLNVIVHPLVGQRSAELMAQAPDGAVVVYDMPLLVESQMTSGFDVVVVVEAAVTTRLGRLVQRGLSEPDARARMTVQATDAQRREVADEILHNDGTPAELAEQVDALWHRFERGPD
ncbi:MAG: dephospho-CoA kinase [Actinomycetota bacterium]|nr:dephospho-CoA kinase [Actinomycetota bacterium]